MAGNGGRDAAGRRADDHDRDLGRPACRGIDASECSDRAGEFDDILAREVPKIEASPAFGRNGVIVVVYDEDERAGGLAAKNGFGEGGHVVCAILSPVAVPGSYGGTFYHYSLLRTIEDGLGLTAHVGYANDVTAINTIWRTPSS